MEQGFDVVIRRASDGVERTYHIDAEWREGVDEDNLFWWDEGNGACDCNRGNFFNRAGGDAVQEDEPCGDSRFLVMRFLLPDGREVPGPDAETAK